MFDHDDALASAFDGQAARFERAPVQSDPKGLERLIRAAITYAIGTAIGVGVV